MNAIDFQLYTNPNDPENLIVIRKIFDYIKSDECLIDLPRGIKAIIAEHVTDIWNPKSNADNNFTRFLTRTINRCIVKWYNPDQVMGCKLNQYNSHFDKQDSIVLKKESNGEFIVTDLCLKCCNRLNEFRLIDFQQYNWDRSKMNGKWWTYMYDGEYVATLDIDGNLTIKLCK